MGPYSSDDCLVPMIELSVLIPVWRTRPIDLLNALWEQARGLSFPIEVWVCDDSADPNYFEWHNLFHGHPGIRILTFSENLGRSRARNTLLKHASGIWVLWLDGDLEIPPDFLKEYQEIIKDEIAHSGDWGPVVCGGFRVDPTGTVLDKQMGFWLAATDRLRYRYALKVEGAPASVRRKSPYRWIRAAHCLMPARAAQRLSFPEFLEGYGHEDTHWALQIKSLCMDVRHIDHPVEHRGIDTDAVFLEKSRQAAANLARLWRYDPLFSRYGREISMIRAHDLLQSTGLMFFLSLCAPWLERRLRRSFPISLITFAWVKLIWFDQALRSAKPF